MSGFSRNQPKWLQDLMRGYLLDTCGLTDYERYCQTHDFVGEQCEDD